jgi:undecaprenyl-diphosphatase
LIVNLIALGDALPVIIIAMGLCSLALVLGQLRDAVLAIVGPLLTGLTTTGVKPLVGRIIRGSLAYPSGHTGAWTSLGLVAALVLIGLVSASALTSAVILASGAVLAGATMATALILSGDHYPSDTVGGFCAALVCVLGCVLLIERIAAPSSRHRVRVEGYVPENED